LGKGWPQDAGATPEVSVRDAAQRSQIPVAQASLLIDEGRSLGLSGRLSRFDQGKLHLPGTWQRLAEPGCRAAWWQTLYAHDWVVYSKRRFGGPAQVLKYLARYTHRVAIRQNQEGDPADG
jgi:hypothetical protein